MATIIHASCSLSSTRELSHYRHGKRKSISVSSIYIRCAKKKTDLAVLPSLRVPNPLLARSALAVFGLGFIDAGYSGDWSRIGAISNEAEGLLKLAAFVVVPLCIFTILCISTDKET